MSYDDGKRARGKPMGQLSDEYLKELERDLTSSSAAALVPQNLGHRQYNDGEGAKNVEGRNAAPSRTLGEQDFRPQVPADDQSGIPDHEKKIFMDAFLAARNQGHDVTRATSIGNAEVLKARGTIAGEIGEVAKQMSGDLDLLANMLKGVR